MKVQRKASPVFIHAGRFYANFVANSNANSFSFAISHYDNNNDIKVRLLCHLSFLTS